MNGYEFDLGFLGGGQLARMSIQAAQRMGLNCISLDPDENSPAAQIASSVTGALNDAESVAEIIRRSAKITLENEFIPARVIRQAFAMTGRNLDALLPGINSLELIQDKYHQRKAFKEAALKGPKFALVEDDGALAVASIGFPMILKARFGGYDGKGTQLAESPLEFEELSMIWRDGGWYAEEFVHFKREIAVMVYRTPAFEYAFPTMETRQTHHVCDLVYPAANIDARDIALAAVRAVEGFGLYGVEMFDTEQGILINEIAPRPHNSGHFSLDWGGISQFETHVRLCMDMPIPTPQGEETCMANLLGQEGAVDFRRGIAAALKAEPAAHIHWYGKAKSKPGRKMGHINVVGNQSIARAERARAAFYRGWTQAD